MSKFKIPTHPRFKNLTGQVFGGLTVVAYAGTTPDRQALWECHCICGKTRTVRSGNVRSLSAKEECQCQGRHGLTRSRVYRIWSSMMDRCNNPRARDFEHYGGRGISVCERWHNVANFASDMGHPGKGMTLERNEVDGDYCPENCRWASWKEQQRNKRNNHRIEHNGESLSISEWAERTGIHQGTILFRVTHGWTAKEALETPPRKKRVVAVEVHG